MPYYEGITFEGIIGLLSNCGVLDGGRLINNIMRMQYHFRALIKRSMHCSRKYTRKNILKCADKYNSFLIGSDLVWDLRYADDYTYMLDFVRNKSNKIAYAASYGYDKVPTQERQYFYKYLSDFKCITVREKNAAEELSELLNRNVKLVCDPTMLIDSATWLNWVKSGVKKRKYVFVYMPDEGGRLLPEAKRYARKHKLQLYLVSKIDKEHCPVDPIEFLTLLYNADAIFTGSYHGLLFSLYFHKKIVYANRIPGNRIKTVAEKLCIQNFNIEDDRFDINVDPDYTLIEPLMRKYRNESMSFLEVMLNDACK